MEVFKKAVSAVFGGERGYVIPLFSLPKIALDSALRLNTYFQKRTTWEDKDIPERGAALFLVAKKVWPRP